MESNDILSTFPEITDAMIKTINRTFIAYIFYKRNRDKSKECWCTSCNRHYTFDIERTMDNEKYKLYRGTHGDQCLCPKCGTICTLKAVGKLRSRNTLWEESKIVCILPEGHDKVYIRAYYCFKSYKDSLTPEIRLSETTKYILTPGESRAWKSQWCGNMQYRFNECKNPIEPFNTQMGEAGGVYLIINKEVLDDTFLKYSQRTEFSYEYGGYDIKYLQYYARHPQIEMFMKLGFESFVKAMVIYNQPNKQLINWNAKKLTDAFRGLTKQQINELRGYGDGAILALRRYRFLMKKGIESSFSEIMQMSKALDWRYDDIAKLAAEHNQTVVKVYRYIAKKTTKKTAITSTCTEWKDYIEAAKKINYNLSDEQVLFPKKLKAAHDTAIGQVKYVAEEQAKAEMKKIIKQRFKQYSFEGEEYFIKIPESMQEIIDEGQALSHCVGGYAERHAKGQTTILFLRRKDAPEKPLYTIEVWDKTVRQIQGYKNKTPLTDSAKAFFEEWKAHISQKPKKKPEKLAATA